jgi:hypothetical protein
MNVPIFIATGVAISNNIRSAKRNAKRANRVGYTQAPEVSEQKKTKYTFKTKIIIGYCIFQTIYIIGTLICSICNYAPTWIAFGLISISILDVLLVTYCIIHMFDDFIFIEEDKTSD